MNVDKITFDCNLTAGSKLFFIVKLSLGLRDQLSDSQNIYTFTTISASKEIVLLH